MGLRIGTPDAEATITTRSARLDPGYSHVAGRRLPRRRPTHVSRLSGPRRSTGPRARPPPTARSSAAPTRRSRRRSRPRSRRPLPGTPAVCRRCPTSGTASAFGSSPVATAVSRAAARATTPSAEPNGCQGQQLAVDDGDDHRCGGRGPARHQIREQREAGRDLGVRPGTSQVGLADEVGRREHVQPGECLQRATVRQTPSRRPCSSATRTAPASTGPTPSSSAPGQRRTVQRRRRPRRPQARLRRGRRPSAAVHRVVVQLDERVAGPFDGRGHARAAPRSGRADLSATSLR